PAATQFRRACPAALVVARVRARVSAGLRFVPLDSQPGATSLPAILPLRWMHPCVSVSPRVAPVRRTVSIGLDDSLAQNGSQLPSVPPGTTCDALHSGWRRSNDPVSND